MSKQKRYLMNINQSGLKEYTIDGDALQCKQCGHNSWREGNDGDIFCVPCMYGLPISNKKTYELSKLLNRGNI